MSRPLTWLGVCVLLSLVGTRFVLAQPSMLDPTVTQVSSGWNHTCVLTTSGGVKCWGYNGNGELGDGTLVQRSTALDVSSLTSGVASIASGGSHTCALTTGGGVKCWGNNFWGELGDGTTTQRSLPVEVSGLTSGVAAISSGQRHTCALTTGGGVKCWGFNGYGGVGDGTSTHRSMPVDVSGLTSGMSSIAAGPDHSCALTTTGGVKCWGQNGFGQIGDGTAATRFTPVNVTGLTSGVAAIAAGGEDSALSFHTCALTTAGGVKCWGSNASGELGDGTTTNRNTPVDVPGLTSGVAGISVGQIHACALTTGGGAKCWGGNTTGALGDGTTTNRLTAVNVNPDQRCRQRVRGRLPHLRAPAPGRAEVLG